MGLTLFDPVFDNDGKIKMVKNVNSVEGSEDPPW